MQAINRNNSFDYFCMLTLVRIIKMDASPFECVVSDIDSHAACYENAVDLSVVEGTTPAFRSLL